MKKVVLTIVVSLAAVFAIQAADIYHYQERFNNWVDSFTVIGYKDRADFEKNLQSLDRLQRALIDETELSEKEPLLGEIQAVFAFVGEMAPDGKSYGLTIAQKEQAKSLLGVSEARYDSTSFCLPINSIVLWDSTFISFFVENPSDSLMVNFKLSFTVQRQFSSSSGFLDGGVSKLCSRSVFSAFLIPHEVKFMQEKCETQIQITKYIQPEVVQPVVEKYAEPDYLSPQQKQALKVKEKEQLKRQKEKAKQQAKRDKEKRKKQLEKERAAAKKAEVKAREQKAKEQAQARKEKREAAKKGK
ncbi:MAG: hypothetical protein LBR81_05275 [Prevotellaceae bacterium]|jgi:hypothetical protein|nr:hypothetical protein [Prevotellaceae bacterium]